MRKAICALIFVLMATNTEAYAHPPSRIQLSYDKNIRSIQGRISHAVSNPKTHYVKKVIVKVNGEVVIEHTMPMQEGDLGQYVQYTLPGIKNGDIIRLEASCSSFGHRVHELKFRE